MKAKTLALSAIICGASILGLNFSTADAATLQSEKINQIADIEQLITYRDSNRYTGGERARRAIEEAARRDRYDNRYERERREKERQERYEKERREKERQERYERERRNKIEHRR